MLTQIDHAVCHGVLGHRSKFLTVAQHIQALSVAAGHDAPVLDADLARATIALLPKTLTRGSQR